MKVTVKTVKRYEIEVDGSPLGEFAVTSSWNGLSKFEGEKGIIIANTGDGLEGVINEMFDVPHECEVVKISPELAHEIAIFDGA